MRREGFGTGILYVLMVLLTVGLGFLIFFNFRVNTQQMAQIQAEEAAALVTPTAEPTATPAPTAEPERTVSTIRLAFAGDLVGQSGLTTDAQKSGDDGTTYDYWPELEDVEIALEGSELAACTLVSTLSGDGNYDSYHMDASLAEALSKVGFQLVNVATDRAMDYGVDGLSETVDILNREGITALGVYKEYDEDVGRSLRLARIGDITVAYLSYTYGTGGKSVADNSWCIDILTTDYMTGQETIDYDKIDADIAAVKNAGADIVVCFVYWWDNAQYYTNPRSNQTEVADYLVSQGVDVLIGGGVKVPQPIEYKTVERADGTKANVAVCYSLSNLMSCFNDDYTNVSAVATIQISRDVESGEAWVSGVETRPLFMLDTDDYSDYNEPDFKFRLLDAATALEDYENGRGDLSDEAYEAAVQAMADLNSILGEDFSWNNGGVHMGFPY